MASEPHTIIVPAGHAAWIFPVADDERIGAGGRHVDSTAAQRAREAQERADTIIHRESELGIFDPEDVRELGKYAI